MNWKEHLSNYFGFEGKDGTYVFILNRVKEAKLYGTLTIDDFQEVDPDEDWYEGLEDLIKTEIIEKLIEDAERSYRSSSYIQGVTQQLRDKWL